MPQPARPLPTASDAPGSALFRALLAAGADAVTAYTAMGEVMSIAGQSVTAQLGAQIQAVATTLDGVQAGLREVKADLREVKADLAGVRTDVAVLTKQVRLIWAFLSLQVVTLTGVLIRLFAE